MYRRSSRAPLTAALACSLAVIASSAMPGRAPADALSEQPMIGEAAPAFRLPALSGATVDLNALRGQYVLIHFATTWCPYCNAEAPALQRLQDTYGDRGLRVLVVDVKEERERVAAWAARHRWSFPVLLDADGAVATAYAPDVLPDLPRDEVPIASNLLIGRDGRIRFYSLLDSRHFDAKLAGLEQHLLALLEDE